MDQSQHKKLVVFAGKVSVSHERRGIGKGTSDKIDYVARRYDLLFLILAALLMVVMGIIWGDVLTSRFQEIIIWGIVFSIPIIMRLGEQALLYGVFCAIASALMVASAFKKGRMPWFLFPWFLE